MVGWFLGDWLIDHWSWVLIHKERWWPTSSVICWWLLGGAVSTTMPPVVAVLFRYISWSNYSDLTRPHPKWWFRKGNPLISGKSGLVKYYNSTRYKGIIISHCEDPYETTSIMESRVGFFRGSIDFIFTPGEDFQFDELSDGLKPPSRLYISQKGAGEEENVLNSNIHLLSLKLTVRTPERGRAPKGSKRKLPRLPTIYFQVRTVSFREGTYTVKLQEQILENFW